MIAGVLLVLPDGRLVLHRRGKDAPTDSGLLSIFGGHAEPGESPEQTALREVKEETSISYDLKLEPLGSYVSDGKKFYTFRAPIKDEDFKVYEGVGAEVYTVQESKKLKDLAGPARFALTKIGL